MNAAYDNEVRLNLLRLIEKNPELSQREMSQQMNISLGKINYCISALVEKGKVKVERFKNHKNKTAYIYRITPKGLEELSWLTLAFLKIKIAEYGVIKEQIQSLYDQINEMDPSLCEDPELIQRIRSLALD